MIRHVWSILCERVTIDSDTKLASYLICIEGITAKSLPASLNHMALGSRWYKDSQVDEELQFQLMLISPSGEEKTLITSDRQIIQSNNQRINVLLNGLSFPSVGTYIFKVRMKSGNADTWIDVQEIPLTISLQPALEKKEGDNLINKVESKPGKGKRSKRITGGSAV